MKFEFFISSAAIATICSLISNLVAAKISAKSLEKAANKEIEKMELAWNREDMVSTDEDFSDMVSAIASFTYYRDGQCRLEALQKVAVVRAKENGALAPVADELYTSIQMRQYDKADILMTQIINEKRKIKNQK